jgi:hypothetical protein
MRAEVSISVKDLGLAAFLRNTRSLDKQAVVVGLPSENSPKAKEIVARGDAGHQIETYSRRLTVAMLGAIHEFGSPSENIPARPFMAQTYAKNLSLLKSRSRAIVKGVQADRITAHEGLSKLGEWYTGAIKEEITTGEFAPLKPATVAAKGSSRPLIDTAQMRNSITWKRVRI